jgi:hypothetical protein
MPMQAKQAIRFFTADFIFLKRPPVELVFTRSEGMAQQGGMARLLTTGLNRRREQDVRLPVNSIEDSSRSDAPRVPKLSKLSSVNLER